MKKAILALVLAIAVYTVLVLHSDIGKVAGAADSINPRWIPLFLLLPLGNYYLRFLNGTIFFTESM